MALEFGLLVGGILTVMLYSRVFYKDTIVYSLSEHILLGTATGYVLVTGIKAIVNNAVTPMQLEGKFIYLIPIFPMLSMYFQIFIAFISFYTLYYLVFKMLIVLN